MAETEVRESPLTAAPAPEVTVIESPRVPLLHSVLATALWIGCIHLFFAVMFTATFLLPLSKSIAVFALLLVLIVVPVEADSKFGMKVRRYIFKNVCGYYPITVHVEDIKAFVPNRAYIFALEPHSVLPVGVISLMHLSNAVPLPKTRVLASSAVFRTPFLRHIWTWMGLAAVTRKNFISLLAAGYSCAIIPGGTRETLLMVQDHEIAFLKTRKGFVRTAIETGVPLIPVFSFGQSKVYNWWRPTGKLFLQICRKIKFTPMFFWGVLGTPMPRRLPLHVVVGRPIEVKQNSQPTAEEVNEVHSQFVGALQDLFERHKARVGHADRELKII
ncbi:diacylglycerol O-acyltransferase 2D [Malania oleifera]|uniref:diacylglycerol O-acyltransferase 2D n=1 Tax=Malania oleifera TaxID=397392 RepID=UPI0025AECCD1|nr:diacylglycerol O-acyltransferase 2D [Malania oleifera]